MKAALIPNVAHLLLCGHLLRGHRERDAHALLTDLPQQEPGTAHSSSIPLVHNTVSHRTSASWQAEYKPPSSI